VRHMLSFDAALERVLAHARPMGVESVEIGEALGRVLAEAVTAIGPFPPANTSAMDGYAVRSSELEGAGPFRLEVIGESRAGVPHEGELRNGACRIFTGALLPDGADAVVIQEDVKRTESVIEFPSSPKRHQNVRLAGEDIRAGDTALERGIRLNAFQLSLLASLDRTHVNVTQRPRVALLATGSELRPVGKAGALGSIPESNSVALAALARQAGAVVIEARIVGDDLEQTRTVVERLLAKVDLLVTVGGVSVGDYDVVKEALEKAGVVLDFWKVAIKPGKPLVLGRTSNTTLLALPGNPVSAQVTFCLFGLPLLKRMQGASVVVPPMRHLRLASAIRQAMGRRGYHRVCIDGDRAEPLFGQSSGSVSSMAWADGLAVVSEEATGAAEGDLVPVLTFADL
jgi:molybdopterin molybdotransferase